MKSSFKFLALLLILTLAISGCVSDKNSSKTESVQNSTSKTESATSSITNNASESSEVSTADDYSYTSYKAAVEKTKQLKVVDGVIKEQYDVDMSGVIIPMSVEASYKIDFTKKEGILQSKTGATGVTIESSSYYVDGFTYTDFAGTKTKAETPFEDIAEVDIQVEIFEQSSVKSSEEHIVDGIKYHKITVSGIDFLSSSMAVSSKAQLQSFVDEVDYDKVDIGDVTILLLYKDGYIVKTKVQAELKYNDGENDITVSYSSEKTLNSYGESVVIEAPSDLDQYTITE